MAQKVTIEFTDKEDGEVGILVSFDPPATEDGYNSPAAQVAMAALREAMNMNDVDDSDDDE